MGLRLVSRRGCHLCEEAETALRELGLDVETVDVDADAELHALYDFRVPVLLREGRIVGDGRLSKERLQKLLDRSREGAKGSV